MGESRPEKSSLNGGTIIVVEECPRGIPAVQMLEVIAKLGSFAQEEVPHVPMPLWDIVMDRDEDGMALYAVAPDPEDAEAEFVAYWHFGKDCWVWEA